MTQPQHSKRAVWLAVNSEHGDRLVEIAQEHLKLVKSLPQRPPGSFSDPHADVREIIYARIEKLRSERDAIISKYEEV